MRFDAVLLMYKQKTDTGVTSIHMTSHCVQQMLTAENLLSVHLSFLWLWVKEGMGRTNLLYRTDVTEVHLVHMH